MFWSQFLEMLAQFNHLRPLKGRGHFIEFGRHESFKTYSYMTTHFLRRLEYLFYKKKKKNLKVFQE